MKCAELITKLRELEATAYGYNINGEVLGIDCAGFEQLMVDAADAIETAEYCINAIEDALDRGNDNDWAREAIAEYRREMEGEA